MINYQDKDGFALIHYFTYLDYHEMVRLLAENGADLELTAKDGNYPLMIAAARGHEKTV